MTLAAIPTLGHSDLLYPLVRRLVEDPTVDAVRVYDNGIESASLVTMLRGVEGLGYVDARGRSLYGMWNDMIAWAVEHGARVAILNDDIAMADGTLCRMAEAMESDERYWICGSNYLSKSGVGPAIEVPCGTYRHGGIGGWAFMVDSRCPLIDESFEVWYGDDDLCWKINQAGGKACVATDSVVFHTTSATLDALAWVPEAKHRDSARWNALGRP